MVISYWNRMLRIPNLVIILLTQVLIYVCFIKPYFATEELALSLTQCLLFLFTLLCLAGSGYVINTIYDREIDSGDPDKSVIPLHFSERQSWQLYAGIVLAGFIIAIFLSVKTGFYYSLSLYPVTAISLWFYSFKLKCVPLLGNILIAFLTGAVIAIIPFVFWDNLKELRISDYNSWASLMYRFVMLFILAVLSNLSREVVKDIEDMNADKAYYCNSTATYFGLKNSKTISLNVWFALMIICGSALWYQQGFLPKLWIILIIEIPALAIFILMIQAKDTRDFTHLSLYLKLFMLLGITYWCIIA